MVTIFDRLFKGQFQWFRGLRTLYCQHSEIMV